VAKSGDNLINLSSSQININTGSSKGFEKVINIISSFVINVQDKFNKIVYGDVRKKYDVNKKTANKKDVKSAFSNGLLYVLDELSAVDFCNIINYALNKNNSNLAGNFFNPTIDKNTLSPIDRKKWNLQKIAYDVQTYIDDYKKSYQDPKTNLGKTELFKLITKINNEFASVLIVDGGLNDLDLNKEYPELSISANFLKNALGFFNRYTDVRQIPNEDLQKIIQFVDKIRGVCIAIQGLKSISTAINVLSSANIDSNLKEQIARIEKLVPIDKIVDLVVFTLNTANNINSIAKSILSYISTARVLIRILVILVKIFKIITTFLKALPIPSLFSTVGSIVAISSTESKLNKFIEKTIDKLQQINSVLVLITILVTNLIIVIDQIIQKLTIIKLNLENCQSPILGDINKTITDLSNTKKDLESFISNYNNNKSSIDNKFGIYTISIVSEEITDDSIQLKRRYGIATNSSGFIVANSTPTFASLDLIIINEVKVQLVSKGLVDADLKTLSTQEIQTLTESLNYLETGDINIQDITSNLEDVDFSLEENSPVSDIGSFVDNLSGGKKLRKKIRAKMKISSQTFKNTLSNTSTSNNYGKGFDFKV
jgi:hypothetical protein